MTKRPRIFRIASRNILRVTPKTPFASCTASLIDDAALVKQLPARPPGIYMPTTPSPNLYLVPAEDDPDVGQYLDAFWADIFECELNEWWTDRKRWPKNRTREMFEEWLDVEVLDTSLYDLDDEPLERDIELE